MLGQYTWRLLVSILFMVRIHSSVNIPCGTFNFGPASYFIPEFKWGKQELWQCFSQNVNSSNCSAHSIEPVRVKSKVNIWLVQTTLVSCISAKRVKTQRAVSAMEIA